MESIEKLYTEQLNHSSSELDTLSSYEIVALMNAEDHNVPQAVSKVLKEIAAAVEVVTEALAGGGRLVYVGAGTSGRLGVLDASECPPTFSTDPSLVVGIIAGGQSALLRAKEGAEDDANAAVADLEAIQLSGDDAVVGISASGRTPYVYGALQYARSVGASTIALSCNHLSKISAAADVAIEVLTGPEILGGSTRLKAGSAEKMVLNMISTASMVRLGKVYKNLMVDLHPTNQKLVERACHIVMSVADVDYETARSVLKQADYRTKVALVMVKRGVSAAEAEARLNATGGFIRPLLDKEA